MSNASNVSISNVPISNVPILDLVLSLQSELGLRLHSKVASCYTLAEQYYLKSFPRPALLINLRGLSAGVAELQKNRLRFNAVLLQENERAFLNEVVPHEVAHLLAWQLYGRSIRPHGVEWQQIMQQVFQLTPTRTHAFDVKRAAKLGYKYTCHCKGKEHALTLKRHNLIKGGRQYICLACKRHLHFLKVDSHLIN